MYVTSNVDLTNKQTEKAMGKKTQDDASYKLEWKMTNLHEEYVYFPYYLL